MKDFGQNCIKICDFISNVNKISRLRSIQLGTYNRNTKTTITEVNSIIQRRIENPNI